MNYDNPKVERAAELVGLPNGRMISMSKSRFIKAHPDHVAVFNATIADDDGLGAWWGDIDLTTDEPKLRALARSVGIALHLLHEGDTAWVLHGRDPHSNIGLAVVHLTPTGDTVLGEERGRRLIRDAGGRLVHPPRPVR